MIELICKHLKLYIDTHIHTSTAPPSLSSPTFPIDPKPQRGRLIDIPQINPRPPHAIRPRVLLRQHQSPMNIKQQILLKGRMGRFQLGAIFLQVCLGRAVDGIFHQLPPPPHGGIEFLFLVGFGGALVTRGGEKGQLEDASVGVRFFGRIELVDRALQGVGACVCVCVCMSGMGRRM